MAQESFGGFGVTYLEPSAEMESEFKEISEKISVDIIVQKKIIQHERMAAFNPSSVNSLRLYSVLSKDGNVKVYSAVCRMGVGNTKVDNYASGGVSCGVDENGFLRKYGYSKTGERTEAHPASNIVFEGYSIPNYDAAVRLVEEAHKMVPHFRSVSWDIAITAEGAVLIEANLFRGGIDLLQLSNGPLYGEDTKKILDEVFKKSI